jgi:hypothetical protein
VGDCQSSLDDALLALPLKKALTEQHHAIAVAKHGLIVNTRLPVGLIRCDDLCTYDACQQNRTEDSSRQSVRLSKTPCFSTIQCPRPYGTGK